MRIVKMDVRYFCIIIPPPTTYATSRILKGFLFSYGSAHEILPVLVERWTTNAQTSTCMRICADSPDHWLLDVDKDLGGHSELQLLFTFSIGIF